MIREEIIESEIIDLVSDLLHYDRKEDEDLPRGAIEQAVENGEITVDQMVQTFREALESHLRA